MKLIYKIALTHGVMFIAAITCALLAFFNTNMADFYTHRTDLAHRSYESHLQLSAHSFQLFKHYTITLIKGEAGLEQDENRLLQLIKRDIHNIKSLIHEEIDLVGDEELPELEALDKIEQKIENARTYYKQLISQRGESWRLLDEEDLILMLNNHIDIDFAKAIQAALDEEQEEVIEANTEAKIMLDRSRVASISFTVLAICAGLASLYVMYTSISRPLQTIIDGAKYYSNGLWQHRISLRTSGELHRVAQAFNKAAEVAGSRELSLNEANQRLAKEVNQQTTELRTALLELKEQAKVRRQLLADVSHELRTPLTIIQGEVDVALRGKDKNVEEYKEALSIVKEATQHTTALVNDVLFVARQESGHSRLSLETVDLLNVGQNAVQTLQQKYNDKEMELIFNTNLDEALIEVDKQRIYQVFLILLENALQYGKKKVAVNIAAIDEGFSFFVKDDGPGIHAKDQINLFHRFFRGSNASEQYTAGNGLGLPVAKTIIDAHKGEINVFSEPGEGAEFRINLFKHKTIAA